MKLTFEPLNKLHLENVCELYRNKSVRKFLGGVITGKNFEDKFKVFLKEKNKHWSVFNGSAFVGLVSLDLYHNQLAYEVSYQLMPEYWRQGYGKICIKFLVCEALSKGLDCVVAETQAKNERSIKLLESQGFYLVSCFERHGALQNFYQKSTERYAPICEIY